MSKWQKIDSDKVRLKKKEDDIVERPETLGKTSKILIGFFGVLLIGGLITLIAIHEKPVDHSHNQLFLSILEGQSGAFSNDQSEQIPYKIFQIQVNQTTDFDSDLDDELEMVFNVVQTEYSDKVCYNIQGMGGSTNFIIYCQDFSGEPIGYSLNIDLDILKDFDSDSDSNQNTSTLTTNALLLIDQLDAEDIDLKTQIYYEVKNHGSLNLQKALRTKKMVDLDETMHDNLIQFYLALEYLIFDPSHNLRLLKNSQRFLGGSSELEKQFMEEIVQYLQSYGSKSSLSYGIFELIGVLSNQTTQDTEK